MSPQYPINNKSYALGKRSFPTTNVISSVQRHFRSRSKFLKPEGTCSKIIRRAVEKLCFQNGSDVSKKHIFSKILVRQSRPKNSMLPFTVYTVRVQLS